MGREKERKLGKWTEMAGKEIKGEQKEDGLEREKTMEEKED